MLVNAPGKALEGMSAHDAGAVSGAAAFEDLFHVHYERIARAIARVIRDPARAEDLAVEVFWKFWRHGKAEDEDAGGWLYRTAVRMALDELRQRARRIRREASHAGGERPLNPEEAHAAGEEQEKVRLVLAAMNTGQAELLLLRSNGLSYGELAAALNLNPASVGTLMGRAQQAFRKEYVKQQGGQR